MAFVEIIPRRAGKRSPESVVSVAWRARSARDSATVVRVGEAVFARLGWALGVKMTVLYDSERNLLQIVPRTKKGRGWRFHGPIHGAYVARIPLAHVKIDGTRYAEDCRYVIQGASTLLISLPAWAEQPGITAARLARDEAIRRVTC